MVQGDDAQFTNRAGVTVDLSDEAVLITRKGEAPPLSTLAYGSIQAVVFKRAGITNGYIQFCTATRKKVDSLSKALGDPHTVVFSKDTSEDFERLRDLVNEKLEDRSTKAEVAAVKSPGESARNRTGSKPPARAANYRDPNKPDHGNLLLTIVCVVVFFGAISRCGTNTSSNTVNIDENTVTDSNLVTSDLNPTTPPAAQAISRYVAMDSNVRAGPTSTSRALGKLARGSRVEGSLVAGTGSLGPWLKLTTGPHAGNYILAAGNLRRTAPPAIDSSAAGYRFPVDRTPIYAEPTETSEVLDYAAGGTRLHVYGRLEGGFLEVGARSDRVGYVREEALHADGELEAALDELEVPPAPTPIEREAAPPVLRNPLIIGPDDYPMAALSRDEEGHVRVTVNVDIDGRVTTCVVTRSSGSASLDEASCRLMRSRARFDPAIGPDGRPAPGLFTKTINWQLGD